MISSKIYTDKKIFSLPEGFIKLVTTNLKVSDNVLDNTNDGKPSSSYQKKKKPSIISTRKFWIWNQTQKKPSINYNSSLKNAANQKEILELKLRGELKLLF